MIRLVSNIQTSLTPQDTSKRELFWEDGVTIVSFSMFLLCMAGNGETNLAESSIIDE